MKGSHVKLRRDAPDGIRQTLTIPDHDDLATGTLHAIHRQARRYLDDAALARMFF